MGTKITNSRIAKWRIESDEEKRLATLADKYEEEKINYVNYYRENDPVYYEKGMKMIEKVLDEFRGGIDDTERQKYIVDMIYSLHRFGCMYNEYFLFGFENLNTRGRGQFITDKNRYFFYDALNSDENFMLFKSKERTYAKFKDFYKRDVILVSSSDDFDTFCSFREKHQEFIVKPQTGHQGRGVFIEHKSYDNDRKVFERIIKDGPVVIEELVKQAEEMAKLHPESVNTVRIPTVKTPKGEIILFHPRLRVGIGSSIVDNAGSGGIIAPVDPETGIVTQQGITEHGKYYLRHPDTGVVFPGFQVPKWNEAVRFVNDLANVLGSGAGYVGWDCALTEKGWIMLEGNLYGQFGDQYATKIGDKNELEEILGLHFE